MEVNSSSPQLHFNIIEASQIAEARRLITAQANNLGFNETEVGQVAIVVTEAATNLIKHAGGGQLLARPLEQAGRLGLEILALDQGPGIANINQALADGHSSAGTSGNGLGAITRLAAVFDIHSQPAKGTALLAQLYRQDKTQPPRTAALPLCEVGAVCLAKRGESVSGDNWAVVQEADRCLIMAADGLGHGLDAAAASRAAVEVLAAKNNLKPAALIELAHTALFHTRGAAVAVVELDLAREVVRFAGVGNIAGALLANGSARHLASYNGIVGHQIRKIQEFSYPWSSDTLLVLHSDGLATQWNLNTYPGLITRHPSLIAGVLYRDFCRGNDDVSVVVVKQT